jgi:hypothetical protein
MKRLLIQFVIVTVGAIKATAAIIHVQIPEEEQLFLGLGELITRDFDFNQDNTADLRFTASRDGFVVTALHNEAGISTGYFSRNNFLGSTAVPFEQGMLIERYSEEPGRDPFAIGVESGGRGKFFLLSFGALDGGVGGVWYEEEAYLGFNLRQIVSGEIKDQFGWLRLREFAGAGGYFMEYAYESEFNTPIAAGVVPEPGTLVLCMLGLSAVFRRRRNLY